MKVVTVVRYRDLKENRVREVGDEFDETPERVAEINGNGYGVLVEMRPETVAEYKAALSSMGVEFPKGAKKADLKAVYEGAL